MVMIANPAWWEWEYRAAVLDGAERDFREMERRPQVHSTAELKNEPGSPVSMLSALSDVVCDSEFLWRAWWNYLEFASPYVGISF